MFTRSSVARRAGAVLLAALAPLAAVACRDSATLAPTSPTTAPEASRAAGAPSPIVDVAISGRTLHLYPFAGSTFGTKPEEADPINVIFTGSVEPRGLRAALLALDGDRTAFGLPNAFPFNCTWSDAIGEVQGVYVEPMGWLGSAIQLQCGDYSPMRFHLRLFGAGDGLTIGGAHTDLLAPGTQEHKVISWKLARLMVMVDFARSGILSAPPGYTAPFTPTPTFRTLMMPLYNGLPPALRVAIEGPMENVTSDWPIPNDGLAVVLNVASTPETERMVLRRKFTIDFDQTIPKPFCESGPYDYIYVTGPIDFDQRIVVTPSGNYISKFHATGHLDVTPVPDGETFRAVVNQSTTGIVTDRTTLSSMLQMQLLLPPSVATHGRLTLTVRIGPDGLTAYSAEETCAQ